MDRENCSLKLVDEIILYYDARPKKYQRILKYTQIPNFTKIRTVEAKLFHADGQTDLTKLIVPFCNFVTAPNN